MLYVDGARPPRLRAGLQPRVHFRALNPMCWFLAVELYGRDASPEICRYSLDADAPEVPGQYREQACREPSMRARAEAQRLKAKLVPEAAAAADDEDEVVCCGCVTRDMLECMTFHLFTCCAHMRDRGPHYARVSRDDDEARPRRAARPTSAAQPPAPRAGRGARARAAGAGAVDRESKNYHRQRVAGGSRRASRPLARRAARAPSPYIHMRPISAATRELLHLLDARRLRLLDRLDVAVNLRSWNCLIAVCSCIWLRP